MDVVYGAPDVKEITGFQRTFQPPHKRVWVSDYNMVNPTDVPRGKQDAKSIYDMMPGASDPTPFQRETFPAVMTDPADTSAVMIDQAKDRIEDEEGNTFSVQGQSKNPTFIAGGLFHIAHDKTKALNTSDTRGHPAGDKYLITQLSFAAFDNSYGHTGSSGHRQLARQSAPLGVGPVPQGEYPGGQLSGPNGRVGKRRPRQLGTEPGRHQDHPPPPSGFRRTIRTKRTSSTVTCQA